MSRRKHSVTVAKCGGYNDTGNVHQIHTRFGDATLTYGEYRGLRQTMWYEGRFDAVFWLIGKQLDGTSTCYEHTFRVEKVEMVLKHAGQWGNPDLYDVKVECSWTSYVGD
jgi:hypothetical protein